MRGRIALTLVALAVAGCGGSSSRPTQSSSPRATLDAWHRAIRTGDAKTACGLMTRHGRQAVETILGRSCARAFSRPRGGERVPRNALIGVRGNLALAVTGANVVVLRRSADQWLVDLPSTPVPESLKARGVPAIYRERLPSSGAHLQQVLGAAGRYIDSGAAGNPAVHVNSAAVVGDVAVVYLLPGSDVPAAASISGTYGTLILAREQSGWQIRGGCSSTIADRSVVRGPS